jgi:hypothetical protein
MLMLPDELIEDILSQAGLTFVRRESSWAVASTSGLPREVLISPVLGGITVESTLATWDAIGDESTDALAAFLETAQAGLRYGRCELRSHSAHVVSQIRTEDLGLQLMHGLRGVAAAIHVLAREASALLVPELAHIYLELSAQPGPGRTAIAQVDDRAGVIRPSHSIPSSVT